jgi:vacuolar-type H+-ATPase subunit H
MAQTTTHTDAGSVAAPAKEQAKEQVSQAKEQAKEQVQQARAQARDRLREQVDQRSTQAGERVTSTAQDVRSVADELRRQGKDQPARMAEQAADRVERAGGYLRDSDADKLLRDVEDFGRQRPWAVALAGLALGFAASRFLKASSSRRSQELRGDAGHAPSPTPAPPASSATTPPA